MTLPEFPLRVCLVGAGRVGTAVAVLLSRAGHHIAGVASPTDASARAAARRLGTVVCAPSDLPPCDVVLIGAPAETVAAAAAAIAEGADGPGVFVHFAGAYGIEPLRVPVDGGKVGCALHPVQTCPDVDSAIADLPGSAWGVTTSVGAEEWAERFVAELGGIPVRVAEADRPVWHAAAVTTSNGISALLAAGERMLAAIDVAEPAEVLGPIASATVANARAGGGAATLTGPVVRGEADAVARHLQALEARAPDSESAYALISRLIVEVAKGSDRIDEATAAAVGRVLDGVAPS